MINRLLYNLTPPLLYHLYKSARSWLRDSHSRTRTEGINWVGNYSSWNEAKSASTGYEAKVIFERTAAAIMKVKRGGAVYERDSVIFDQPQFSWPLIALMLRIAVKHRQSLSVLDFGGSLGSSYFQNRDFFNEIKLMWGVVEQEHYIEFGNEHVAEKNLKFYYDVESCILEMRPTVLLLSGVIQCLENPDEWLTKFKSLHIENILFDRTAFIEGDDRLTVQKVPKEIYSASYPAWFFNRDKFIKALEPEYRFVLDFNNGFTPDIRLDGKRAYWNGMLFERV